jgi:RNA polymerase sigma factor (sigma-70 family)
VETVATREEWLPDEALLAGLGAGDADLTIAFVRRFQRIVFGVALAITSDPATAEDIAQRAFEQAWRRAPVYDSRGGSVRVWLTSITHNLAVDVLRARTALPTNPDDLAVLLAAMSAGPESTAVANDRAREVRQALGRLPVSQARTLVMAGIYGMTAREIADAEEIPVGTAKTRIRDGMQKLRIAYLMEGKGTA